MTVDIHDGRDVASSEEIIMSETTAQLREVGFNNQHILTFLLGKFSDPRPLHILRESTLASLTAIHAYKQDRPDSLPEAYAHMQTILAQAGRLSGSLKSIETNWDASLGTLVQSAYNSAATLRQRLQAGLERLAAAYPFVQAHRDFLSAFIHHFSIRPLEVPETLPSRQREFLEQASSRTIEIGKECRDEICQRFPELELTLPPPDAAYVGNYAAYCEGTPALQEWQDVDWGGLTFETSLGSFDFNAANVSTGLCRFCGCVIVVASTVGFVAGLVTVNPVLVNVSLTGLVTGAALAVQPDAAVTLAQGAMPHLSKLSNSWL
jgi:hypothetical protein